MTLHRGRGRITTQGNKAVIVAHCPLCGQEHRYTKGDAGGAEIEEIRKRGFTDEWLPCQMDLPGNFWRVVIAGGRSANRPSGARRKRGPTAA